MKSAIGPASGDAIPARPPSRAAPADTPAWLSAGALLLWGFAAGQALLGAGLAVVLPLAARGRLPVDVDDALLNRIADLSLLAGLVTAATLILVGGLPGGLLSAVGWLPLPLLPLLVVALSGRAAGVSLRLRHVVHLVHRRPFPEAETTLDPAAAHLLLTLLAAGALAAPRHEFFWAMVALLLLWRRSVARPQGGRAVLAFAAAAVAVTGVGFALNLGIERTHQSIQQWIIDAFVDAAEDPYRSQTRIGDLGQIKLSEKIVWRVEPGGQIDLPLRLRSGVFVQFSGTNWLTRRDAFTPLPPPDAEHPGIAPPTLTLRGNSAQEQVLPPLPLGTGNLRLAVAAEGASAAINPYGVIRLDKVPSYLHLEPTGPRRPPSPPDANDLVLPPAHAGLLARLPELAPLRTLPAGARVDRLADWFASGFRYTLALGKDASTQRSLDDFLFRERAGHCEYFATATVLLLRALGVPARYVTGYSVQEYSRLEKAFIVRQRHAHAWVEAWVDDRWIEVDTTPSIWLTTEEQQAPFWQPAADFASWGMDRLGRWRRNLDGSDFLWPAALATGLLIAGLWHRRRRKSPRDRRAVDRVGAATAPEPPELAVFRRCEAEFAALGLPREAAETPRHWVQRLAREGHSVLTADRLAAAGELVETLYRSRYRPPVAPVLAGAGAARTDATVTGTRP